VKTGILKGGRFAEHNLKKQSQSPAFGRKPEARISKSETEAFDRDRFEKTKPISEEPDGRKVFSDK
jgi:hypothetical protein